MPTKSNTTKYLLIAGVAVAGYFLYTRSSGAAASQVTQPNAADSAFVLSWATGLAGQSAINFQNAFPSLTAADISGFAGIIRQLEATGKLNSGQQEFYDYFASKTGF